MGLSKYVCICIYMWTYKQSFYEEVALTPIPSGLLTTTGCPGGVSLPNGPRVADSGNPRTVIKNVETQVLKGEFSKWFTWEENCYLFNYQKKSPKRFGKVERSLLSLHNSHFLSFPSGHSILITPFACYGPKTSALSLFSLQLLFRHVIRRLIGSSLSSPAPFLPFPSITELMKITLTLVIKRQQVPGKDLITDNFGEAPTPAKPSVCFAHI